MKSANKTICIDKECLPVRATLKVVRSRDPDFGLSQDEVMDRNEHIRCYLLSEFKLLLLIPKQEPETDFFVQDYLDSAFNTHDFQQTQEPFNRYAYAIRKVMEQVRDLAIMHSSISSEEGRRNIRKRFEALVANEFGDRLSRLISYYKGTADEVRKHEMKERIGLLSSRVTECRRIWESCAPPEVWDA